ncbi:PREDICTED: uncharacterized protein LOC107190555 [Dufourea novaeangliae]|uniref:CHK kinase-like domain-containing protein n=1 Tax=Dufourea novaeangliae TaxID=178035 RepID=A0A154PKT0_DUFNO|nr:PREDICTED: uncharacterized protein LOC107190555 [Dufourea novaeangliae]KZC12479.1 hypothetical protein WN55_04017 [Dufourea novaeangliae]
MATISADPGCVRLTDSKSQICPVGDEPAVVLTDFDINRIVERHRGSNNFRILRWSLDSLGETNGYLGSYYTLSVTVRIGEEKSKRELKFFAKTPPPSTSPQYDFLVRYDTFNKEMAVYSELVPRMGTGSGPKWLPDYYLGKNNTIMVMEDAKESGYITPDKFVPLDEEHCVWMVKMLSTFHSRSLIFDEKLRRASGQTIHDLYGHLLVEVAFIENDTMARKYLLSGIKGASAMVDLMEGLSDDQRTSVKDRIARWIVKLPRLLESSRKFRNLICHRDIWVNNIMFRRDSTGRPTGCYLIDYQFLRYSPPALDFIFSLYLNTDRAIRNRLYDTFVDIYWDTMTSELKSEGLDVEECLPRSEFVESCEEIRDLALTYCIANMQIMLLTKDAVEQYFVGSTEELQYVLYGDRRTELVLSQCRSMRAYQTRIIEILEEIKDRLPDNPPNC